MRTRLHTWLDMKRMKPLYGVQVLIGGRWQHLAINGKAAIYKTPNAADKARAFARALPSAKRTAPQGEG